MSLAANYFPEALAQQAPQQNQCPGDALVAPDFGHLDFVLMTKSPECAAYSKPLGNTSTKVSAE